MENQNNYDYAAIARGLSLITKGISELPEDLTNMIRDRHQIEDGKPFDVEKLKEAYAENLLKVQKDGLELQELNGVVNGMAEPVATQPSTAHQAPGQTQEFTNSSPGL